MTGLTFKTTRIFLAFALVASLFVSACESGKEGETAGRLVGAGLGALIGSQIGGGKGSTVAIAVGTLAGSMIGAEVGKKLDEADRAKAQEVTQVSLENSQTGQTTTWKNPDTGNSGSITPTKTYKTSEGQNCREFETTVTVDGAEETAYGTACRQPDGSWKIVE